MDSVGVFSLGGGRRSQGRVRGPEGSSPTLASAFAVALFGKRLLGVG